MIQSPKYYRFHIFLNGNYDIIVWQIHNRFFDK
jgi:hypothetical protein